MNPAWTLFIFILTVVIMSIFFMEEGPMKTSARRWGKVVRWPRFQLLPQCQWHFPLVGIPFPRHHLFLPNFSLRWPFWLLLSQIPFPQRWNVIKLNCKWILKLIDPKVSDWCFPSGTYTHIRSSGFLWFLESRHSVSPLSIRRLAPGGP